MKHLVFARLLGISLLSVSLALAGCGGAMSFPDSAVTSQVSGPAIKGSAFGGHAPIQGMHVYLVQPGTGGYGSAGTSILGNNGVKTATDGSGFTLTGNSNDPSVPPGAYYVTTNSAGEFDLTGMYSCTTSEPVFIYAYGGSALGTITGSISTIGVDAHDGGGTYTVTLSAALANALVAGQTVTISGLSGDFASLNGSQQVLAYTNPSATSFQFTADGIGVADGTYSDTTKPGTGAGAISVPDAPVANPIVQLATLGNCPSSGAKNFSGGTDAISYIYLNEVSTVAAAYTFQPFTSPANNSAWDIGTPGGSALTGIENAANNAGQIYDIQGRGEASSTGDGEGHIANLTTPATLGGAPTGGNGTVPQATVDTLANILAACLDSPPVTPGYTISQQCKTLFSTATSNGNAYGGPYPYPGNTPADIAAAAINIARYPGGNGNTGTTKGINSYTSALFDIPMGTLPYAPDLPNAPNDFALTITYASPNGGMAIGETGGASPHGIAVDASGKIYTVNYNSDLLNILTPLGAPVTGGTSGFGSSDLRKPNAVAVDVASSDVWVANSDADSVSEFTTDGTFVKTYATGSGTALDTQIDGAGDIWVVTDAPSLVELPASTFKAGVPNTIYISNPSSLAIEAGVNQGYVGYAETDYVWVDCSTPAVPFGPSSCASLNTNTNMVDGGPYYGNGPNGGNGGPYPGNDFSNPLGIAIDSSGNAWFADNNGNVSELTYNGGAVNNYGGQNGSPFATGSSASANDGIAIDGGGDVWVTSPNSGTLYELSNSGAAISPPAGYSSVPGGPDGIAIDGSGDVWYSSSKTGAVYEVIGVALPVVTPLSSGVANHLLGSEPN